MASRERRARIDRRDDDRDRGPDRNDGGIVHVLFRVVAVGARLSESIASANFVGLVDGVLAPRDAARRSGSSFSSRGAELRLVGVDFDVDPAGFAGNERSQIDQRSCIAPVGCGASAGFSSSPAGYCVELPS